MTGLGVDDGLFIIDPTSMFGHFEEKIDVI